MQYPSSLRNDYRSALWGLLFGILLTTAMTSSVLAKDKLPEISSDGLHLMKDTKVAVAYVKPGATLNQYTKVKILDCFVQFQKNWERNYNLSEVGLQGRVTDKKVAEMKQGGSGMAEIANRMTNTHQADRIITKWAELLASHLGEVSQAATKN